MGRYWREHKVKSVGLVLMVVGFLVAVVVPLIAFDITKDLPNLFSLGILGFLLAVAGPLFLLGK